MQNVKDAVHRLNNLLQLILSYLETENYARALSTTKQASEELRRLAKMLTGLASALSPTVLVPKGGAVVVPEGTTVIGHEDVNVDVAPDEVRVVGKDEVISDQGKLKK